MKEEVNQLRKVVVQIPYWDLINFSNKDLGLVLVLVEEGYKVPHLMGHYRI